MKRIAMLLGCVLVGCQPNPRPPDEPVAAEIAYAGWPVATAGRDQVSLNFWAYCRGPTAEEVRAMEASRPKNGPHAERAIEVRVSPGGLDRFKAGQAVPTGTTVVKLKYAGSADREPAAVGAMMKREPGYDPDGGDWEYYYDARAPEQPIVRGKIATCVECHRRAAATDFLFRPYLDPQKAAAGDLNTLPVVPNRRRPGQ